MKEIKQNEKNEIERIKQKLKISLKNRQESQLDETNLENKSNISSEELLNALKEIKTKNDLLDTLDTEFSFSEKQLSLTSYLFNKQISQKYLNALKYFILHEPLEKQNEINTLLINLIINLTKRNGEISKSDIITRLEKIEEKLSKL